MMPITPSGTRTREICKPFGRVHEAVTSPTGSGRLAMSRKPLAIALTRASSSASRSMKASSRPFAARGIDVVPVGFEDRAGARFDPLRHGFERGVLLLRRGKRKRARGLARQAPHIEHHRLDTCLRLASQN